MIQKIKSYLDIQKGEIDPLIILFFVFLGIAIITTSVEPFLVRQKVVQISNEIVEEVEYNGVIDSSTTSHVNSLITAFRLNLQILEMALISKFQSKNRLQEEVKYIIDHQNYKWVQVAPIQ